MIYWANCGWWDVWVTHLWAHLPLPPYTFFHIPVGLAHGDRRLPHTPGWRLYTEDAVHVLSCVWCPDGSHLCLSIMPYMAVSCMRYMLHICHMFSLTVSHVTRCPPITTPTHLRQLINYKHREHGDFRHTIIGSPAPSYVPVCRGVRHMEDMPYAVLIRSVLIRAQHEFMFSVQCKVIAPHRFLWWH